MSDRRHSPRGERDRDWGHYRSRVTGALAAMLLAVPIASPASAWMQAHPGAEIESAPRPYSALSVHTPSDRAWLEAAEAIAFELDQAGYRIVPDGMSAGATMTVSHDAHGWSIVLVDATGNLVVEAAGHAGESPQMVGLHAVELVHASRLDVPLDRQQRSPATSRPAEAPRPTLPPTPPEPTKTSAWAFELGLGVSSLGLLGPRLGFAHHWARAELGAGVEGGLGNAGNISYPMTRDQWALGNPRAVLRSTLELAYAFRPRHRLRPLLGVSNELVVPVIASSYRGRDPAVELDTVEYGVFWTPGLDVGTRFIVGPKLALRAAVRAGPLVALRRVAVASGGVFEHPQGVATATMSLLFGPT